jgi:hypothetical protein
MTFRDLLTTHRVGIERGLEVLKVVDLEVVNHESH